MLSQKYLYDKSIHFNHAQTYVYNRGFESYQILENILDFVSMVYTWKHNISYIYIGFLLLYTNYVPLIYIDTSLVHLCKQMNPGFKMITNMHTNY